MAGRNLWYPFLSCSQTNDPGATKGNTKELSSWIRGTNATTIVPLLSLTCFVGFIQVIYVCNYACANLVDPTLAHEKSGESRQNSWFWEHTHVIVTNGYKTKYYEQNTQSVIFITII